jgi:tetratricopeptide (TPR) repeat protein
MKKTLALLALFLPFAPLAAQAPPTQTAPPAQTAPVKPPSAVEAGFQEALKLLQAGDANGAIARLETLRQAGPVPPQVASLLGVLYLQVNKPQQTLDLLKPLADLPDADPAVLYSAGRASLLLGQTGPGGQYLMRSVQKEPSSPAGRDLGLLLAREGRVVEAYSLLRPWSLRNPSDGDVRLMAASLAVQLERPDEAEELLTGLKQDDPAILLLRGRARTQLGDGAGALALLQPIAANHPPAMDLEVRRTLAEANLAAGKPAEAVKLLAGHTGGVPSLVLLLGKAQHKAGDSAAALATLKPLADKIPTEPDAVGDPRPALGIAVEYGSLLVAAGRAQEAVPILEKGTRLHAGLAQALDAAGRKPEAQQARAKAEEIAKTVAARPAAPAMKPATPAAPNIPATAPAPAAQPLSANLQEAMRLMSQGQNEPALAAVRREIAATPADLRPRMLEVRILLTLKRNPEALRSAEAALGLQPNNPDLLYQRGAVEMGLDNLGAAERDFRRAIELEPRHTAAMNDLAVLLISQKKTAEAKALLEQVLKLNPRDQMAAANLQQITGGSGQ